tara:strand:+ start:1212 stop:1913 length:702 start_codon:yes stop_codon:yes gene_type:complete
MQTDSGQVYCYLNPATSENQKPTEDAILLCHVKEPSKLINKVKGHWGLFIAYMECTCIDGEPNWSHKLKYWYLMNFKGVIIDNKLRPKKCVTVTQEIAKYVITIGLSGFLLLIFSMVQNRSEELDSEAKFETLYNKIELIEQNTLSTKISLEQSSLNIKLLIKSFNSVEQRITDVNVANMKMDKTLEDNLKYIDFNRLLKTIDSSTTAINNNLINISNDLKENITNNTSNNTP